MGPQKAGWAWARYWNITEGNSSKLLAKMMGITPAWFTRSGRYWRVPP